MTVGEHSIEDSKPVPTADGPLGLSILKGLARDRSLLTAMRAMHYELGNIFKISMPRFQPVVVAGPDFNRQVLVTDRDKFSWRGETDPVVKLLRHGVLVEDGEQHDRLRACMEPAMRRTPSLEHVPVMIRYTDQVLAGWPDEGEVDMLVEMRKVALLILLGTLYGTDFTPDMDELWEPILKAIHYISPGPWIIWPDMPRPGYRKDLKKLDDYLYRLIRQRRAEGGPKDDLLGRLVFAPEQPGGPGMDDYLIRDQLLTMLIAGHDTSTALLAWALYLLGEHPEAMARVEAEVILMRNAASGIRNEGSAPTAPTQRRTRSTECADRADAASDPVDGVRSVEEMPYLDMVLKETLRMFPPIHVGNRFAGEDLDLQGYAVPEGSRVMVSIYLTHRDEAVWEDPEKFCPHRFDHADRQPVGDGSRRPQQGSGRPPLAYIPFGGGPRNCIGATFAQVEGKVVLARILQQFALRLSPGQKVRPYMGATLEPRPGVKMLVRRRTGDSGS